MNYYILMFACSLVMGITGQLLLKKGMNNVGTIELLKEPFRSIFRMFTNKWVIIGVLSFGLSMLLWLIVLSGLELSYIYPMVSISYVLIALLSKFFFGEKINKMRWLSIGIIIIGVILVSMT